MRGWVCTVMVDRTVRVCAAVGIVAAGALVAVSATREASAAEARIPDIVPMTPARYVDTRIGKSTFDGKDAGDGRLAGGFEFEFTIAGRGKVPADAAAVMLNVTAVRPDGPGHITVYPCGTTRPNVSNINYVGNDVEPNAVLAKIGTDGQVCVFSLTGTDLVIDVNAYVPDGGSPVPINPVRNTDTRVKRVGATDGAPGRLRAGQTYRFTMARKNGVPKDAGAVMLNVTAVRPDTAGFVTVFPCRTGPMPDVSSINYAGGDVRPNAVLVKIGVDEQVCVNSTADTDLLIDVNGYVPIGGSPEPVEPVRYADTRPGGKTFDGKEAGGGRLVGGREYKFNVGTRKGYAVFNVRAAMLNITAVRPDGPGHITVYPCGGKRPNVSSINYRGGDVVPNAVFSEVSDDGELCVFSLRNTDLVIDANAFLGQRIEGGVDPTTTTSTTSTSTPNSSDPTNTDGPTTSTTSGGGSTTSRPQTTTSTTVVSAVSPSPTSTTTTTTVPAGCVIDGQAVATVLPAAECQAMVDLYNNLGGPGWTKSTGWNTATDPCTWYEVVCDKGRIDFISLQDNNLTGQIPASIGDMDSLDWFDVSYNELSGPVPKSILNLRAPWVLRLRGNGCFTAQDQELADWLEGRDNKWNDGC